MCYFIHLKVYEQGKLLYAKNFIQEIMKEFTLTIKGDYPNYIITDGLCSCNLVGDNGSKINVDTNMFKKILSNNSIKYIEVGWSWGDSLPETSNKLKMDINEFIYKNEKSELEQGVLYHINDYKKYNRYIIE